MIRFFFIYLLLASQSGHSQNNYYVTYINGGVFTAQGKSIKVGDKIQATEKLILNPYNSFAVLLSPHGRFVFSSDQPPPNYSNEAIFIVSDHLHIHAENKRLSSRGLIGIPSFSDFFTYDQTITQKVQICDTVKMLLDKNISEGVAAGSLVLYVQANWNGKSFNNILRVLKDTLFIFKRDFEFDDTSYIGQKGMVKIGTYNSNDHSHQILVKFIPIFIENREIIKLIQAVRSALPNENNQVISDEVSTELYYFFGKPDDVLLNKLIYNAG